MRVRVPLMIQDPEIAHLTTDRLVEDWLGLAEAHYLDGPVTERVAVIDLDPTTEALEPGAVFEPPSGRRTFGRYRVDRRTVTSPQFIAVSVFGTVLRTMYLFEERDALGRKVAWAFGGPQLLVVPRAGWWANAYYERRSRSLQFFSFHANGRLVHTSLSRDIVAHETAHALLDGIAPDLYDALDPQGLALHEGVADLTAVLIAFRSGRLRKAVLDQTGGSIEKSTNFSAIGEEFGRAIDPSGHAGWLRNLLDDSVLDPHGDPAAEPEAHELSQVLTGTLYRFLVELHRDAKERLAERRSETKLQVSGRALFAASEQFKRMILRGLDYLPPGEITFADYIRAILAADQASFEDDRWRRWIRDECVRRGIVADGAELDVSTNAEHPSLANVDLDGLATSDWVAYMFAEGNRDLLRIPPDAQFEVMPRVVVNKRFELPEAVLERASAAPEDTQGDVAQAAAAPRRRGHAAPDEGTTPVRELLFKVRWSVTEPNPPDLGAPTRRIQSGATLVIDWDRRLVRSCLGPVALERRRPARDAALRRLVEAGLVDLSTPDDPATVRQTLGTGVEAVVTDGILRVKGTGRLLHVARGGGDA
ncbi:MAG TPA: hypothetical protein VES19_03915 [Candidatus Limnocylindrales bacterium]|nr:hypothetical protein [Candidatus Limnocylindrales bacterium]